MSKIFGAARNLQSRLEENGRVTMDWLVDDSIIAGAGLSVARMTLKPGIRSEGHSHPNCTEVIHLIAGRVEQSVGAERFTMEPGDSAFVPPGCFHRTHNVGNGDATMIVAYSAGTRVYEPAGES